MNFYYLLINNKLSNFKISKKIDFYKGPIKEDKNTLDFFVKCEIC